jgi:hypothetical protein
MRKKGFVWETLVIGMAFGLVLAGCGSTPQVGLSAQADGGQSGDGSGTEDGGAAQLAVDLGEALSKAASGDTVTLIGGVRLENAALTVPSGVTLDVTAEGAALELRDGAVLTVDGTVNALGHGDHGKGWVEGSLRIGNGAAVIDGSGTIRLASKGRLLNIWGGDGKRHLTLDGVTLVGLADNNATLVEVGDGGELILKSGAITGNTIVAKGGTPGGGVSIFGSSSVFTMTGGEISGNNARESGGVAIGNGTFIMEGGIILGNTGWYMGGVSIGHDATFIMEGGAIFGNIAEDSGGVGTVNGTFTLKGGRIQGSTDSGSFVKNTGNNAAALRVMNNSTAKWGTGGTYTKGGVSQSGGSDISNTNDTLIAVPAR